jgi:hypothetical protein
MWLRQLEHYLEANDSSYKAIQLYKLIVDDMVGRLAACFNVYVPLKRCLETP